MNNMYNILWIDDEWDKMPLFKTRCEEMHNLHLEPFRTRKAGIEALEYDLEHWDAVLLDAKMFDEDENETAKLTGLGKAKQRLDELSLKRFIPYFISTGQPDLISDDNFKDLYGDYYIKKKDDERLIKDMLKAIQSSDKQQIKVIYHDVFSAIDELEIDQYAENLLMDILLPLHYPSKAPNFKPVYHYNQLRQLIEYIFRVCNKVGLVPDKCIDNGKVNLNQSSLYLAGKNAELLGIRYGVVGERVIPDYIENIIRSILDFGNVHSHTVDLDDEDTLKIEKILRTSKSRFIVFGLTLHLCEALIWFAEYISKHDDKEINLFYCTDLKSINATSNSKSKYLNNTFVPEQDEDGCWHCGECLVGIKYWESGELIITKLTENTDKKTKSKYPFYASFKKK